MQASKLGLGDIVQAFDGPFGTAVVKQVGEEGAALFRPYAVTGDFAFTGGVIALVGIEQWTVPPNQTVTRLEKGKRLK